METKETKPWRPRSIVGPVILIVLGLAFLVSNFGLVNWDAWEVLWKLWPVWFIAVGIEIMIGRRTAWGSWIVLGLVALIIAGALRFFPTGVIHVGNFAGESVTEKLEQATQVSMDIKASVGELRIGDTSDDSLLIDGSVRRLAGEQITRSYAVSNGTGSYKLRSESVSITPNINIGRRQGTWDLTLNRKVPLSLQIGTGVGESRIDLSRLSVTDLSVSTGIGEATVTLPAQGRLSARIHSGIGQTTVYIPRGMAARVSVSAGLGSVNVRGDFLRDGRLYTSPGFDTAQDRVELDVSGGIGEVRVEVR